MVATLDIDRLDSRILELGSYCHRKMKGEVPSLFDLQYWQAHLLDWVMEDEEFKTDSFRFVEVLPALINSKQISSHIREYLLKENRKLPMTVRSTLNMAAGGIASPIATRAIRNNVTEMARRFIIESKPDNICRKLEKLYREGLVFTADILGEAVVSNSEADRYMDKYLALVDLLGDMVREWSDNPILTTSPGGPVLKANVSVKISALDPLIDPLDFNGSITRLQERLLPLLRHARKQGVFINFDLEQWAYHDITYSLFEALATHPDFNDWPHLGLVVQAYLKNSINDCERLLRLSKLRGTPFTVRLVKGAYWDYEVVNARQHGFACPVFNQKSLTDASYERLTLKLLENIKYIQPAFASHSLRSVLHAVASAEAMGLEKNSYELQMLYGMAEPQRKVLAEMGNRVRIYVPIGDLLPGMGYLVRRLLENTSNTGFLRQSYHEGINIQTLLARPSLEKITDVPKQYITSDNSGFFTNVNHLDFTDVRVRKDFEDALASVSNSFPLTVPVIVKGKKIFTNQIYDHLSPNDARTIITKTSLADRVIAEESVGLAYKAWQDWRDTDLSVRAALLEKLANGLEKDRYQLAALQCYESAKPWREADADVAEAIDFCRYYARQAIVELSKSKQGSIAGEDNILSYEGRGPAVIIAPWNFPLAILCGMTSAALVAGNTVLIKPATAAAGTGYAFYNHLVQAGFSEDVVYFLPGRGEEIGQYLIEHPFICQIAFTGSKEVGLRIIEKAAIIRPEQPQVKRVVCEMGGKNAIIVDEDADLDVAVKGVIQSAFGYAGQKCSACSRVIIVGAIYEKFVERFIKACQSLPMTAANEPGCHLGPVIDGSAYKRLKSLINDPPENAKLLFKGEFISPGFFIPPVLFEVKDSAHRLMQEEFFGPIVTFMAAETFQEAISIANTTLYKLTGAVYSRNPGNLLLARKQFKVGNLYFNRGCTGALVDRQPFGGFGLSGIGTKAGGPGYLRLFSDQRCITENTMRSGFTPDLHE